MRCKLNIIEPWESGTDKSVDADILKHVGNQFIIFVEKTIKVRGEDAHYFICKLQDENRSDTFGNKEIGTYAISMVFDKRINSATEELPDIDSYRANFFSGELIV